MKIIAMLALVFGLLTACTDTGKPNPYLALGLDALLIATEADQRLGPVGIKIAEAAQAYANGGGDEAADKVVTLMLALVDKGEADGFGPLWQAGASLGCGVARLQAKTPNSPVDVPDAVLAACERVPDVLAGAGEPPGDVGGI